VLDLVRVIQVVLDGAVDLVGGHVHKRLEAIPVRRASPGLEQVVCPHDVGGGEGRGIAKATVDVRLGGKVHHHLEGNLSHQILDRHRIAKVQRPDFHQLQTLQRCHRRRLHGVRSSIRDHDAMRPEAAEVLHDVTSDEAQTAGHQNPWERLGLASSSSVGNCRHTLELSGQTPWLDGPSQRIVLYRSTHANAASLQAIRSRLHTPGASPGRLKLRVLRVHARQLCRGRHCIRIDIPSALIAQITRTVVGRRSGFCVCTKMQAAMRAGPEEEEGASGDESLDGGTQSDRSGRLSFGDDAHGSEREGDESDEDDSRSSGSDDVGYDSELAATLGEMGSRARRERALAEQEAVARGDHDEAGVEVEAASGAGSGEAPSLALSRPEDADDLMRTLAVLRRNYTEFGVTPNDSTEELVFPRGTPPSTLKAIDEHFKGIRRSVVMITAKLRTMAIKEEIRHPVEVIDTVRSQLVQTIQFVHMQCMSRFVLRRSLHDSTLDMESSMRMITANMITSGDRDDEENPMVEALNIVYDYCEANGIVKDRAGNLYVQVVSQGKPLPVYEVVEDDDFKTVRSLVSYLASPLVTPRLYELVTAQKQRVMYHGLVDHVQRETEPRLPWYRPNHMLYLFGDRLVINIRTLQALDVIDHAEELRGTQVFHRMPGSADIDATTVRNTWNEIKTPAFDTILRTQHFVQLPAMEAAIEESEKAHAMLEEDGDGELLADLDDSAYRYLHALETGHRIKGCLGILTTRHNRVRQGTSDIRPPRRLEDTAEYKCVAPGRPGDSADQAREREMALEDVQTAWTTRDFDRTIAKWNRTARRCKHIEETEGKILVQEGRLPDPVCPFCREHCQWSKVKRAPVSDLQQWFPGQYLEDLSGWVPGKEPWRHYACECDEYTKHVRCLLGTVFGRMHFPLGMDLWGVMPFIRGLPGTGKSVGVETLGKSMPHHAIGWIPSTVNPLFALGNMKEAVAIAFPEITKDWAMPRDVFLELITGGHVQIERKGVQAETVDAKWPALGVGNEDPRSMLDFIGNILRRIIPFVYRFAPETMDPGVKEAVMNERSLLMIKGVLAYHEMIRDCLRMPLPQVFGLVVKINQWDMKMRLNPFYAWLTNPDGQQMRVGPQYCVPLPVLLRVFAEWWKNNRQGRVPEIGEMYYTTTLRERSLKLERERTMSLNPEFAGCMFRCDWVVGIDFYVPMYEELLGEIYRQCGFKTAADMLSGGDAVGSQAATGGGGIH